MKAPQVDAGGDRAQAAVRAALRIPGVPLDARSRERFEAAFDCDLGHVRIHTDAAAARAAEELDAVAFAFGRDLFFSAGAYEPDRPSGAALIAHEMSHAIDDPRVVDPVDFSGVTVAAEDSATERGATAAEGRERGAGFTIAPAPAPRAAQPQIARFAAGLMLRDPRDPAQLVATLVTMIAIALRNDPDDRLGRVRRSLKFLDDATRALALEQLEHDLVAPDWRHLSELLATDGPAGTDQGDGRPPTTAGIAPTDDAAQDTGVERRDAPNNAARTAGAEPEVAPPLARGPAHVPAAAVDAGPAAATASERNADMRLHDGRQRPHRDSGGNGAVRHPRAAPGRPAQRPVLDASGGPEPEPVAAGREVSSLEAAEPDTAEPEAGGPGAPELDAAGAGATGGDTADAAEPVGDSAGSNAEAQVGTAAEPDPDLAPEASELPSAEPADAPVAGEATAEPAAADAALEDGSLEAAGTDAGDGAADASGSVVGPADAAPPLGDLPAETDDGSEIVHGGGSGGSAIPEPAEEPAAAVPAEGEPTQVLGALAGEAPDRLAPVLDGVGGAVERTVAADRGALAAKPPVLSSDEAARAAAPDRAPARAAVVGTAAAVARVPAGAPPAPVVLPDPPQPGPAPDIRPPAVTSNADGALTAEDAQRVAEAVDDLPTTDPALDVTVAQPPEIKLTGAADPAQATAQRDALTAAATTAAAQGRTDAAEPMGVSHIVAKPLGRIRGHAIAAPARGAHATAAGAAAVTDPAVAAVARERSRDEVAAAVQAGVGDLTQRRSDQRDQETRQHAESQRAIDATIAENASEQNAARRAARAEVMKSRTAWTKGQTDLVTSTQETGDADLSAAQDETTKLRDDARTEARAHVDAANREVTDARREAERQAAAEREKAKREKEDAGFFSRAASAIGDFFSDILDAIKGAFKWARDKINKAIAAVTKFVSEVIDKARNFIVAAIKKVGAALIMLGDTMLAAFPTLRDKWRATINKTVDGAVAAVNRFADNLKKGLTGLLNLLGKALNAILDAYEALALAAVNTVAGAVTGALALAKGLVDALGTFAVLIRDIARDPGQWISNLGSALMDGVRVHLWAELKSAVKEWFNSKVEAVVGVGKMILDVLRNGGLAFRRIAAMVWAAVKAAIPRAIIEFLIQKVIAMIIPAAGAIMAIIEGLQAAWATVSRIIAAFERFVAFLKAVKDGNAGPLFARVVAAAAVAVIDFTANFIISKIGKAAAGVAGKLKSIAAKLMAWFKRGAKAAGRVAKKAGALIIRGVRASGRGLQRAGRAIAESRIGRAVANSRAGRFVGKGAERAQAAGKKLRERVAAARESRKQNRDKQNAERLRRAETGLTPKVNTLLGRGVGRVRLTGWLIRWTLEYGLRSLSLRGNAIIARVNPIAKIAETAESRLGGALLAVIAAAEEDFESALDLGTPTGGRDYQDARRDFVAGDSTALDRVHAQERARIVAETQRDLRMVGDGTRPIRQLNERTTAIAMDPTASRMVVAGITSYPALLGTLQERTTAHGLDETDVLRVLSAPPHALGAHVRELTSTLPRGSASERRAAASFENSLYYIHGLQHGLEPARYMTEIGLEMRDSPRDAGGAMAHIGGVGTAQNVAYALGAQGDASLHDVLSPEGRFAIMTPEGASGTVKRSKRTGQPLQGSVKAYNADINRRQRVHAIFKHLADTAASGKVVTLAGGFDLAPLANAVRAFLTAHTRGLDEAGLLAHEAVLREHLLLFIAAYDGR